MSAHYLGNARLHKQLIFKMAESVSSASGSAARDPATGEGEGARREIWELFSNWACCVCVVTFDLELGQALEVFAFVFVLS